MLNRPRGIRPVVVVGIGLAHVACPDSGDDPFNQGTPPDDAVPINTPNPTPTASPNHTVPLPTETPPPYRNAEMPLQVADVVFDGEAEGDALGGAVAGVGDVNADGVPDFAVAAPASDARQPDGGKVYLFFGQAVGWPWRVGISEAPASFDGEGRNDRAGTTLAGGGDLNGDGLADLVIGAPGHTAGGVGAGRIYGLFGKAEGWYPGQRLANADVILDGAEGDEAGETGTLAFGGDFNGDGFDDLAVGCYRSSAYGDETGHVYLVLGRADGWDEPSPLSTHGPVFVGEASGDRFGFSVALHPDLDGDGYADLLVGAPRLESATAPSLGAVYLFRGRPDRSSGTFGVSFADGVLVGLEPGVELGASVTALSDIDGDGQADVAVGAWGNTADDLTTTRGRFYLLSAKPSQWGSGTIESLSLRIVGDAPYDYVGRPASPAGDVNGDGRQDVLFGNYLRDYPVQDAGNAHLLFGWQGDAFPYGATLQDADVRFVGEDEANYVGFGLAGVGDIDGDGLGDVVIGGMGAGSDELEGIGRAYLVYGRTLFTE